MGVSGLGQERSAKQRAAGDMKQASETGLLGADDGLTASENNNYPSTCSLSRNESKIGGIL